ncbi:MAG: hypothetical protein M1812_005312 [Candelaria pacifica]|nr:MAG: hypothetical protein M1812_005312 [Candelaria pacifica]
MESDHLPATAGKPFPLFKLPIEIRIIIYEYHLDLRHERADIPADPSRIPSNAIFPGHLQQYLPLSKDCLAIFRAGRQLYHESLPVFYSVNTFGFASDKTFITFLKMISDVAMKSLSKVWVAVTIGRPGFSWSLETMSQGFELLATARRLTKLEIILLIDPPAVQKGALWDLEGMNELRRIRVAGVFNIVCMLCNLRGLVHIDRSVELHLFETNMKKAMATRRLEKEE